MEKCPACDSLLSAQSTPQDPRQPMAARVSCEVCGDFSISKGPQALEVSKNFRSDAIRRFALSHLIRQRSLHRSWPFISEEDIAEVVSNPKLPEPQEQLPYLVRFLGMSQESPGRPIEKTMRQWAAIFGANSEDGAQFLIFYAVEAGLIASNGVHGFPSLHLTMEGWKEFSKLKRESGESRRVFMAMPFGNPLVSLAYRDCFVPGVARTGLELFRIDEEPRAGLIDDLIRVAIITSRLVVADLTDANPGAYWEAGFAEGIQKPVLYTCERTYFDAHKGTHFDTRNRQTVIWDADNFSAASQSLATSIRATFPSDVILQG